MMPPPTPTPLARLLSPEAQLIHQTLRWGFEKRIVQIDGGRKVLYRYYLPWQAEKLATFLREAEERGLPVQKLLHSAVDWQTICRHKGYWVATSYIDGQLWTETVARKEHAIALAIGLAGLHSMTADRYGLLTSLHKNSRCRSKSWLQFSCKTAVNFARHLDARQKHEMLEWIAHESQIFDEVPHYQLLHGDLTGKNVLILGSGDIALIDYELCAYGVAGLELSRALLGLMGSVRRLHRPVFLETYLERCPPEVKTHWAKFGAQLLIYQLLLLAQGRVIRFRILKKRKRPDDAGLCHEQFLRNTTDAYQLIQLLKGGQRDPQELLTGIER